MADRPNYKIHRKRGFILGVYEYTEEEQDYIKKLMKDPKYQSREVDAEDGTPGKIIKLKRKEIAREMTKQFPKSGRTLQGYINLYKKKLPFVLPALDMRDKKTG